MRIGEPHIRVLLTSWAAAAAVVVGGFVYTSAATPAIRSDDVLPHIQFLASDDMRGRASGSPELEIAADYIARQFAAAGLQPGGENGSWFQPFELDAGFTVGTGNTVVLRSDSRAITLTLGTSYYPIAAMANTDAGTPSSSLSGIPLVFAGYGISAPGLRYDDYEGLDVRGKAVLVLTHEPQETLRTSRLNGDQPIPETSLSAKALAARNRGALALLVVSDPVHTVDGGNFKGFDLMPDADSLGLPVLRVSRDAVGPLLLAWGVDQAARFIDDDLRPRSRALGRATLDYREALTRTRKTVRNVVGVLPADSGPGRREGREAIVIGAHYDHVGLGGRFSAVPERTGEIHNGADDNASGTASIIAMARAAASDKSRFARALVFVAFAGEERGLLGSTHYASAPVIPLGDTLAMLNLDMVGRFRGSVDVAGLETAPDLTEAVEAAAAVTGTTIRRSGPGEGRSDDFPFLSARVPALSFFTGFHRDYHRPTDDWQRIDAVGVARIANLVLDLAARIAARPDRAEFIPPRR